MNFLNIKGIFIVIFLFTYSSYFSQNSDTKEHTVSRPNLLVDKPSSSDVVMQHDLVTYVESLYANSSLFYNGRRPSIKSGDFFVIITTDGIDHKMVKTKNLKDLSFSDIEEISYKKSLVSDAIYGQFGQIFGMISIKIK